MNIHHSLIDVCVSGLEYTGHPTPNHIRDALKAFKVSLWCDSVVSAAFGILLTVGFELFLIFWLTSAFTDLCDWTPDQDIAKFLVPPLFIIVFFQFRASCSSYWKRRRVRVAYDSIDDGKLNQLCSNLCTHVRSYTQGQPKSLASNRLGANKKETNEHKDHGANIPEPREVRGFNKALLNRIFGSPIGASGSVFQWTQIEGTHIASYIIRGNDKYHRAQVLHDLLREHLASDEEFCDWVNHQTAQIDDIFNAMDPSFLIHQPHDIRILHTQVVTSQGLW